MNWRRGCNLSALLWAALTLGIFGSGLIAISGMAVILGILPLLDRQISLVSGWDRVTLIAFFSGSVLLYSAWRAGKSIDKQLASSKAKTIAADLPDTDADYVIGDDGELVLLEDEQARREQQG